MARKKSIRTTLQCNQWNRGVCRAEAEKRKIVMYCPRERAEGLRSGECCHHPLYRIRPLLETLRSGGVKLRRYGAKLRDPEFVIKLHATYLRVKKKRLG